MKFVSTNLNQINVILTKAQDVSFSTKVILKAQNLTQI